MHSVNGVWKTTPSAFILVSYKPCFLLYSLGHEFAKRKLQLPNKFNFACFPHLLSSKSKCRFNYADACVWWRCCYWLFLHCVCVWTYTDAHIHNTYTTCSVTPKNLCVCFCLSPEKLEAFEKPEVQHRVSVLCVIFLGLLFNCPCMGSANFTWRKNIQ